jgi:hypothetical protein
MKKKLLREWNALEYTTEMLKEWREANDGKLIFPCILQKAQLKNQNGRVYPRQILQREVENYVKIVRENRALGELDHPETSTVALDRASHIIRKIFWDGDVVRGQVEVLNTPKGKILESLLEAGIRVGMSSRGVGSTEQLEEGMDVVQDDYQLICFDAVSEPSTPGAFINESLVEYDPRRTVSKADRIWRALNDIVTGRK